MTDVYKMVFEIIISIIAIVLTFYIVPLLRQKKLYDLVKIAVEAAEQIYKESGLGSIKKEWVLSFLESKGCKVTSDEIDAMIESAVRRLKEAIQ